MAPDVELVIASDTETREAVYRFRQSLATLQGRAPDLLPADYLIKDAVGLQDLLDPFAIVAAAIDRSTNALIAAVRTNYMRESALPLYPELYGLRDQPASVLHATSVTTGWAMALPFATAPSLKDPALGLAWTLYDVALRQRICHDYLDCVDAAVPFFAHIGYRMVREIEHPVRGRSNLMRLDIYDWSYLAEINSPFLALARGVA